MAQPSLHLVDTATGEKAPATDNILMERLAELEADLAGAEREVRKLRRRVKTLEGGKDKEREAYAQRTVVEDIFEEWKAVCDHPNCKLGAKRFDAIRARIEQGYRRKHFKLAILGAHLDHFERQNGARTEHYDDIELVCRDEIHFERFANRGARA